MPDEQVKRGPPRHRDNPEQEGDPERSGVNDDRSRRRKEVPELAQPCASADDGATKASDGFDRKSDLIAEAEREDVAVPEVRQRFGQCRDVGPEEAGLRISWS